MPPPSMPGHTCQNGRSVGSPGSRRLRRRARDEAVLHHRHQEENPQPTGPGLPLPILAALVAGVVAAANGGMWQRRCHDAAIAVGFTSHRIEDGRCYGTNTSTAVHLKVEGFK